MENISTKTQPEGTSALRVLLGTTDRAPYEETAPADMHATFNAAVLGSLLTVTPSFELEPGLIKQWSWDAPTCSYLLTLRDDVVFHNGRSATAADLEFTILRGFFTTHRSFYWMYLQHIAGIEAAANEPEFRSGVVSGVKIEGPLSVRLTLNAPDTTFLFSFTQSYFSLVAKEALQQDYINWRGVPIGAGPYRVMAPFDNGKVILELVQSRLTTAPKRIVFHTRDTDGPYDVCLVKPSGTNAATYAEAYTKYPDSVWTIFFSYVHPLGAQLAFRRAVQHGVNRSRLAKDLEQKFSPTFELLPKHFWGRANKEDSFDPVKSHTLLQTLPKKFLAQEWPVPVFSGATIPPDKAQLLDRLRHQLAEVGIKVRFIPSTEKFLSRATAEHSPMKISGRVTNYVEPYLMFASFHDGSPYQFERPQIRSEHFETLFAEAQATNDKASQVRNIRTLSAYANEIVLAVPLLEQKNVFYYRPATIASLGEQSDPLYVLVERIVPRE